MTNTVEKEICLSIPFPSSETATLVYEVLNVDRELRGCGVERKLSTDGSNFVVLQCVVGRLTRHAIMELGSIYVVFYLLFFVWYIEQPYWFRPERRKYNRQYD